MAAEQTRRAQDELRAAIRDLEAVAASSREETPAYYAANDRVIAAEAALPWWRRLMVRLTTN